MRTWRSAGDLLRWWRTGVLGWTQQQAADRLNVRPNALSNWERGQRAISLDRDALDEALGGGRFLADLLWAYGTPDGLDAGRLWSWVFPGESHPVWAWIRSPSERLMVVAEWGVTRLQERFELGPNGLFITVGASIPDSPVVFELSEPGWVDFGSGEPPADVSGAEVISAIELMQRSSARGPLMDLFSTTLEAKVALRSPDAIDLAESVPGAVDSYLDRWSSSPETGWSPVPEGADDVERGRFSRLRRARGLSLAGLAALIAERTDVDVGRDTLRRFEGDVGQPHHRQLAIAADHVLGAGGRLAVVEIRPGRGESSVQMPPYWRGPIWIGFDGPDDRWPVTAVLKRGNWHREVELDGPRLVSAHWFNPAVPLRISAPPDLRWTVGVGRRAGAEAIDQDWVPGTVDVAKRAVSDIEDAIYGALRRTKKPGE